MTDALRRYYDLRAGEYDRIYQPRTREHGEELELLREEVRAFARGRRVLEIACGTGYWTQAAAGTAASVVATDASEAMLARARARGTAAELRVADAYAPPAGEFDAVLAMFWLSHVPRARLDAFFAALPRGAALFFADNLHVEGQGGELVQGEGGDTFKQRRLDDGSEHLVLKNYLAEAELRTRFAQVRSGRWFWRGSS